MTRYFLGVDTGGTKSHALIADERGGALGFGEGGPGNPQNIGYEGLAQVLSAITRQALAQAGISVEQIAGAGFGIGGYDWNSERAAILQAIAPLGLNAPVEIVNDATLGILAGTTEGWGVAVVSGSGCNCRGWDRTRRREGRVTGYGFWMGEGAGASELILRALQAVAYEWTRRGPATRLTPALVAHFGARNAEDLLERLLLEQPWGVASLAAPVVFRVAAEGDPVARDLIVWAGRELASLVIGVVRQLELETETFEVVMVGSMFNGGPLLVDTMQEALRPVAPQARFVRLTAPPAVGAVMLGMEQGGMQPQSLRQMLIDSTSQLLARLKIPQE
jgi:N-acetylglucosamine kinase-like BadF-type ATPase